MVTISKIRIMPTVILTLVLVFTVTSIILSSSNLVASPSPVSAQTVSSPLQTEQVKVTRDISAPIDQIWSIVSNVDEEAKYWSIIKVIKYINKTDHMIDRGYNWSWSSGYNKQTDCNITPRPEVNPNQHH